ncbi:hypothetical protein D3C81_858300 [compost metagenome]
MADGGGLAGDRVALVDQAGDDLCAYALQLFSGWRRGFQLVEQLPQTGLRLGDGLVFLRVWRCRQGEEAVATGVGVVTRRAAGHQFFSALQLRRDASAVAAVKQCRDQAQGIDQALVFGCGDARHVEGQHQARQLGLHVQGDLALARFGQFQRFFRGGHFTLGDRAEIALGQGFDFVRGDIANHHQRGVVGHVPGFVPVAQLFDFHPLKVGHPADGRRVIAACRVSHGLETLVGLGHRLVVGTQATLFLDDLDFLGELVGRQAQAGHAVGFQFEGHAQAIPGQHLVIGGEIIAGECVLFGAEVTQDQRGFAGADFLAALEHHVFQGVGQAGIARRLVAGADLVPDLGNHNRCTMVFAHNHLQAIVESEFVGGLRVGSQGRKGQANCAEQQACGAAG